LGGIATMVLAVIGLAGIRPEVLVSIATVVFGAALLIQGGAMLSEFAQIEQIETTSDANVTRSGGGLSTLFLVGVAGIVLGVLALLGVHAPILTAISAIGFGAALVISSAAVWQLLTSRSVAMRFRGRSPVMRIVAAEVASGSAGVQAMAGLAVLILGLLAVCGIYAQPLTLIALLVAGAAILLTGSTLSATMIGFMRSSVFAPSTRAG
jgi:ABC-type antimicrobial peptide transport system permease subunit